MKSQAEAIEVKAKRMYRHDVRALRKVRPDYHFPEWQNALEIVRRHYIRKAGSR